MTNYEKYTEKIPGMADICELSKKILSEGKCPFPICINPIRKGDITLNVFCEDCIQDWLIKEADD